MRMKLRILLVLCALVLPAVRAADTDADLRTREVLRLVHEMKMAASFRESVNDVVDRMQKDNPDLPQRYWDGVKRMINTERYTQAAIQTLTTELSLAELRAINAVMCDPVNSVVLRDLMELPKGADRSAVLRYVEQMKAKHGSEVVDRVLQYGMGPLPAKLAAATGKLAEQERQLSIDIIMEAQKKFRATRG